MVDREKMGCVCVCEGLGCWGLLGEDVVCVPVCAGILIWRSEDILSFFNHMVLGMALRL